MKIIVIGSGLSGLTAAAVLAKAGHHVTVCEQFDHPGGITASYRQDGFTWDLGQLLMEGLGPGEPVGMILDELGLTPSLQFIKDDRNYIFPDFDLSRPATYGGPRWRMEKLRAIFPQDAAGLDRYWKDYLQFTRLLTWARRSEWGHGLAALNAKAQIYLSLLPFLSRKDWNARQMMESYFKSPELQCVFISILADFFTMPSQFPGLGVFTLNAEASFESRMPSLLASNAEQLYHYSIRGGIGALAAALAAKIQSCGGTILTHAPVDKINIADGKVTGVVCQEKTLPADAVIASGGVRETFLKLIDPGLLPAAFLDNVKQVPLMDSVFMVHLGLDYDPAVHLPGAVAYYYGTYDIESGIAEAHTGIYHEGEKGFVVHHPTRHSPEMAPAGMHGMTIYTICPDRLKEGNWEDKKEYYADRLVECAERRIPGLKEHTRVRVALTPDYFRRRTHVDHHAFGGLAPLMNTPRIQHRTPIAGLWFIGDQSISGGGINPVMTAAYHTAHRIHKQIK